MKIGGNKCRKVLLLVVKVSLALVAELAFPLPSAYAGGTIKVDDDKWISVGMGVKAQFSALENQSAGGQAYSKDFGITNALIYINGKIHKYVGFEFNTECFNCSVGGGGSSFGGNSSIGVVDAIGKFELNQYVNLWVGRMLVTGERSELTGPFFNGVFDTFKMAWPPAEFSPNFGSGGAGLFNRDNGATFWGRIDTAAGHLQYSLGVFSGLRSSATAGPNQSSNLLYAGRLTYNFFNPEENPGYYTQGTYFGTAGTILALAVGGSYQKSGAGSFEHRSDFASFATDLLFEKPFGNNMDRGVFTYTVEWKRYWADYNDAAFAAPLGDCFCMFRGQSYTMYGMYLLPQEVWIGRFQPYGRYTFTQPERSTNRSEVEAGVNYVIDGFNARISAYWQYGDLETLNKLNYAPGVLLGDKFSAFRVGLQFAY